MPTRPTHHPGFVASAGWAVLLLQGEPLVAFPLRCAGVRHLPPSGGARNGGAVGYGRGGDSVSGTRKEGTTVKLTRGEAAVLMLQAGLAALLLWLIRVVARG
jgi:hypothetical protein